MSDGSFLLLETELFLAEQEDKDLDHWFLGADCAGWFYARLLPQPGITQSLSPVMEDWGGWTMAVQVQGLPVWINIWRYFPSEKTWLLGIKARKRFLARTSNEQLQQAESRVADALQLIVNGDPRFTSHEWRAENPFETDIEGL